jgi:hypothetical protein
MSKRKLLLGTSALIFTVYEAILFYLIHFKKADPDYVLCYRTIIVAAVFSWLTLLIKLLTAKEANEKISKIIFNATNGNLIRIAMIFTLIADYYLVTVTEDRSLEGVSFFLGTQLFLFLHIIANDKNAKWHRAHIITRIFVMAIMVAASYVILDGEPDTLAIISMIYYGNLLTSILFAHRSGRGGFILTIGLILFALCDVNVGLSALDMMYVGGFPEGSLPYMLLNSEFDLIWVFYIPSQTLIPLTLMFCDKKRDG